MHVNFNVNKNKYLFLIIYFFRQLQCLNHACDLLNCALRSASMVTFSSVY